jgi:CheY-like chemotaxis protein
MSPRADVEFVLVDDDAGDVELMKEALGALTPKPETTTFASGEEALAYLQSAASDGRRRLVLLDLNMPGIGGRETLNRLKRDHSLRALPIVILTTSSARVDIRQCYEEGANCYIIKPLEFSQLITVAKRLQDFWLGTVALPEGD